MNIKALVSLLVINTFIVAVPVSAYEGEAKDSKQQTQTQKQKRDAASGLPTGKRDAASGLPTGKRDAASGLPTGKRQHKPVSVTKHVDKASPMIMQSNAGGASKGKPGLKAGYRLCPDGTKINPGEKCPEKKMRAGYRLCPDGTKINPGEKCPEKKKKSNR